MICLLSKDTRTKDILTVMFTIMLYIDTVYLKEVLFKFT